MKKIVLMVTAMMVTTFCLAKTENTNSVVSNTESYDMTVDMRRLAVTLGLTFDQMEAVQLVHDKFNDEMHEAALLQGWEREVQTHKAVRKDIQYMHYVLNDKQFRTYMKLLGTTLHNKGLR